MWYFCRISQGTVWNTPVVQRYELLQLSLRKEWGFWAYARASLGRWSKIAAPLHVPCPRDPVVGLDDEFVLHFVLDPDLSIHHRPFEIRSLQDPS